jgi:hypothetical protein
MKLDTKIVEAEMATRIGPFWWRGEWLTRDSVDIKRCGNWVDAKDEALRLNAELSARRVLKAASENVPWEVSLTVAKEFEAIGIIISMTDVAKILSAGLAKWAEEE